MTILVDSGVLYAYHDTDATRHDTAQDAMERVAAGECGRPFVSDYLFDETLTLTLARTGRHDDAKTVSDHLLGRAGPDVLRLLFVGLEGFERAVEVFETYDDQSLSFTDATTVALVERRGIDHVLSFDDDFDGIVDRLDPAELG